VNGVRLVYPMEEEAMQFLNMIANKAFGMTFSWLLGQNIKDTLAAPKSCSGADYEAIARNRPTLATSIRRRLRPHLWRGEAEPAHGGPADSLPRPHVWRNQYSPLEPRLALLRMVLFAARG